MDIGIKGSANVTVVSVSGRVDATTAPELVDKLTAVVNEGKTRLVIDFEKLEYVSSAGLRALLATAKLIESKSGRLVLSGLRGPVRQVFEISGMMAVFQVVDTETEAIGQF